MNEDHDDISDIALVSDLEPRELLNLALAIEKDNGSLDQIDEVIFCDNWLEYATDVFDSCYSDIVSQVNDSYFPLGDYITIDYETYAEQLSWDYASITVDGLDYYYR